MWNGLLLNRDILMYLCTSIRKISKHVYTFSRLLLMIFLSNVLWHKIEYPLCLNLNVFRNNDMFLSIQIDTILYISKYDDRNWWQSFCFKQAISQRFFILCVVFSHHGQYIFENDLFYICVQNLTISFLRLEKIMATYDISETNL